MVISYKHAKSQTKKSKWSSGKIRYYTSSKLLTTIYNALFESHMRYRFQMWGKTNVLIGDVVKLQKKAMRKINFIDKYTSTKPLFSELRIISFDEFVNQQNCVLVLNVLKNEVTEALQELFKNATQHYHNARAVYRNKLNLPQVRTSHYGLQSMKYKSAKAWNKIWTKISDKLNIGYWPKSRLSKSLKKYYFNNGS